jgi:hypothetical protein
MQLLDQDFWVRFAETTWEKKSVTVKNIHSPLLHLDQVEIFRLLVIYSDRCRRLKRADGMKFYIQGQRQFESEVIRHLPKKSDRDLAGYHERMNSQYEDYCLVCDELLRVSHDQQESLAEFTSLLFANVGLPNRFAEMGLYLGNYRKTPFGVHEDACGVFSFPLAGKKKFRIWKPSFVKRNPKLARAFSYAKYKRASQVLEAYPGDMTYWPSSAWHIAESDGSFSATWSLGIWVDKKHSDVVSEVTGAIFKNLLAAIGETRMTPLSSKVSNTGEIKSLPDNYLQTLSALRSLSQKELESAFRESWIKHFSNNGFKNSPSFELELRAMSVICLRNSKRPVHWMRDGSTTIYAFNGTIVKSSSKALFRFLTSLNQGRALLAPKGLTELKPLARAGAFKKFLK